MPQSTYKEAVILDYDCGEATLHICCLEHLGHFDSEFKDCLDNNELIRKVFKSLTDESDHAEQFNEASGIAKIYIEHALLNRARFACTQKLVLSEFHKYIPSEELKQAIRQKVDDELEYVSKLLRRLSGDKIEHMKNMISHWLSFVLVEDEEESMDDGDTHQGPHRILEE